MPRWPWRKRQTAEELIAESRAAQPADPRAADQATVDHLRAAGGDLDKVTHVIHYVYLPDEPAARACQAELEVSGFGVRTFPPDRDVPAWSLHVDHEMVVSVDSITEARVEARRRRDPARRRLRRLGGRRHPLTRDRTRKTHRGRYLHRLGGSS